MTEAAADRAKLIAYVTQALQLDPTRHSDKIITARTAALGLATTDRTAPAVDFQQSQRSRQQATVALANLRTNFWNLPENGLQVELNRITSLGYDELTPTITKLQTVASHRQAFLDLSTKTDANPKLIEMLKDIFALAPRETAELKEGIRLAFRRLFWRRVQRQYLFELRDRIPELWRLEESWLKSLLHQRPYLFPPRKNHASVRLFAEHIPQQLVHDDSNSRLSSRTLLILLWGTPLYIFVLYLIQIYITSKSK